MYSYHSDILYTLIDSDGENGVIMTGVSERVGEKDREEGMVVLKKKMKELSAAHDVVIRNRCVSLCVCVCVCDFLFVFFIQSSIIETAH